MNELANERFSDDGMGSKGAGINKLMLNLHTVNYDF